MADIIETAGGRRVRQTEEIEHKARLARVVLEHLGPSEVMVALFDLGWISVNEDGGELTGDTAWIINPDDPVHR